MGWTWLTDNRIKKTTLRQFPAPCSLALTIRMHIRREKFTPLRSRDPSLNLTFGMHNVRVCFYSRPGKVFYALSGHMSAMWPHLLDWFFFLYLSFCCNFQVVYFGDSMRSDIFPASTFGKWETVMIVEEMEGEGVPKSDAAMSNEAQVQPMEKKGKFEVSSLEPLL